MELARALEIIQREARGMTQFMGQELEGPCAVEVNGSVNGSTRKKLVKQRDQYLAGHLSSFLISRPGQ